MGRSVTLDAPLDLLDDFLDERRPGGELFGEILSQLLDTRDHIAEDLPDERISALAESAVVRRSALSWLLLVRHAATAGELRMVSRTQAAEAGGRSSG